jgi:hypothetical protein
MYFGRKENTTVIPHATVNIPVTMAKTGPDVRIFNHGV